MTQGVKRWPIIRHVRWFFLAWGFERWWQDYGRHLGAVPNQSDLRFLEAVWEGRA